MARRLMVKMVKGKATISQNIIGAISQRLEINGNVLAVRKIEKCYRPFGLFLFWLFVVLACNRFNCRRSGWFVSQNIIGALSLRKKKQVCIHMICSFSTVYLFQKLLI